MWGGKNTKSLISQISACVAAVAEQIIPQYASNVALIDQLFKASLFLFIYFYS